MAWREYVQPTSKTQILTNELKHVSVNNGNDNVLENALTLQQYQILCIEKIPIFSSLLILIKI